MEILVFLVLVLVLDIAAWFWGVDSRDLFSDDPNTQSRPHRAI
jgi:hypothetical protein